MAQRVVIKSNRKYFFLKEQEINFVEAAGNYVQVGLDSTTLLTRTSLTKLATLLNGDRFVRVHRSALVNLDHINHLEAQEGGEYLLRLRSGKQLKASRAYATQLLNKYGLNNGTSPG